LLKEFYTRVILTKEAALAFFNKAQSLGYSSRSRSMSKMWFCYAAKKQRGRGGDFKPV